MIRVNDLSVRTEYTNLHSTELSIYLKKVHKYFTYFNNSWQMGAITLKSFKYSSHQVRGSYSPSMLGKAMYKSNSWFKSMQGWFTATGDG